MFRAPTASDESVPGIAPSCFAAAGKSVARCLHCEVRQLAVCGALDDWEIRELERAVSHLIVKPDHLIIAEDDPAGHVFILTAGVVALSKSLPDGRRQITGLVLPGDFFGQICDDRYCFAAEAATRCELCRLPRTLLEQLCAGYPELERRVRHALYEELCAAQAHLLWLGRKSAAEKLASFLLTLSRRAERRGEPPDRLWLALTRSDIADCLGLTDETVSRTFSQFTDEGLVELPGRQQVVLRRLDVLEALAQGMRPPAPSKSTRRAPVSKKSVR